MTGDQVCKSVTIDPDLLKDADVEMLQDLILTASNEALRQMEEISSKEMAKLTGGLGIPGL